MRRSWWGANRFWLPLVPVALVAMLAGSAYHVHSFWFRRGEHHAVATGQPGRSVAVDLPYTDTEGRTAYHFRVRLLGLGRVEELTDSLGDTSPVPRGSAAYRVRLGFTADPSIAMPACLATIVDAGGNLYQPPRGLSSIPGCTPVGHPGPDAAVVKGMRRGAVAEGDERPARWTTGPEVLVPEGTRPVEVRLALGDPDYVSLRLP